MAFARDGGRLEGCGRIFAYVVLCIRFHTTLEYSGENGVVEWRVDSKGNIVEI